MLIINCPKCRHEIEIPADKLGETVTCDSCKTSFPAGSAPDNEASHASFSEDVLAENEAIHAESRTGSTAGEESCSAVSEGGNAGMKHAPLSGGFRNLRGGNAEESGPAGGDDPSGRKTVSSGCVYVPRSNASLVVCYELFTSLFLSMVVILFQMNAENLADGTGMILFSFLFLPLFICFYFLSHSLGERGSVFALELVLLFLPFVNVLCILFIVGKSIVAMESDAIHLGSGTRCARLLRCNALVLLPVFLMISVFFLFQPQEKEKFICMECGIQIEKTSIPLPFSQELSFSSCRSDAFSKVLDPEHRCAHAGERFRISEETYYPVKMFRPLHGHRSFFIVATGPRTKEDAFRDFVKQYWEEMGEDSFLYSFLGDCAADSYVRRMVSARLDPDEIDCFEDDYKKYRRFGEKAVMRR